VTDPAPQPAPADDVPRPGGTALRWPKVYWNSLARLGEIFVVVIDTSVITSDIIRTLKEGLPSPLLLAMKTRLIRGFMAHHTWAEVPRVLAKRAPAEGVDPAAAEMLWWRSYVPVIRFVATGDLPPADPALEQELRPRDASDLPTLRLASLLGRTVVLATDRDLRDIGLAYDRWREIPEAIRKIVAGQGSTELAARVLFGTGYGAIAAIRAAARALQRPTVAVTVLSIAALAAVTSRVWHPYLRRHLDDIGPGVREVAASAGRAVLNMFEQYGAALAIWAAAQRGQPGRTLTHRTARILAASPQPMTRTEITAQLHQDVSSRGHRAVMTDLHNLLHQHRAFIEVSRGRWQLGKENANLGGLALTPAPPAPVTTPPWPARAALLGEMPL
jgi:hypothetical protein